jgi:hypothetical protein
MSEVPQSELVDVDVAAVLETAHAVEGTLYSLVEFDRATFNALYVSEATRGLYDSDAEMDAHFERIHDYVNIDFTEIDLFTRDLFDVADHVRYKATGLDVMTILRVYLGDQTGLFLAIDRGDPIEPLVQAIETVVED